MQVLTTPPPPPNPPWYSSFNYPSKENSEQKPVYIYIYIYIYKTAFALGILKNGSRHALGCEKKVRHVLIIWK